MSATALPRTEVAVPPAEAAGLTKAHWLTLAVAFLGWMFDGLEIGLLPLAGQAAITSLTGDKGAVPGWFGTMTALFLVGAALGGALFGWLGDRVGRVRAMALAILCYSAFTGLGYFVQTPGQLAFLRFLAALGMGGEWALGVALVMEVWPARHRPLLAGLIGAASNVGFFLLAVIGMFFKVTEDSWRWVMLVGAAPGLLALFVQFKVPESEAWRKVAAAGPGRPLRELFSAGRLRTTLLAVGLGSVCLLGTWGSVQWVPNWIGGELLATASPEEQAGARAVAQACSAGGAIIGCVLGAVIAGRVGRRPVFVVLCLLSLASVQAMYSLFTAYGPGLMTTVFFVGLFTAAFYGWLPLYLPELFPPRIRATGQGIAFNGGRLVAAVGAIGNAWLVSNLGGYARAGMVISLVYVLGVVLIAFLPETKGRPLPE